MNYEKIYDSLIQRAKNRTLDCYKETHHIIPRCMGGLDDVDNLAELTPEEHYLVHQILIKIYPENKTLIRAALMMIPNRPSNKLYGWLRRKFAESQTGDGNSQFGTMWIHNDELRKSSKINSSSEIPIGWIKGRKLYKSKNGTVYNYTKQQKKRKKTVKTPKLRKPITTCNNCIMYMNKKNAKMWYNLFLESNEPSIRSFVRNSNYPYSHISFIKMLKTYIEEFKPEKGKSYSQ